MRAIELWRYPVKSFRGERLEQVELDARGLVGDAALDALLSERYGEPLTVAAEGTVSHLDAGPVHLLTTSSLRWVVDRLGAAAADVRRYRPNVLLETQGDGLVEESWIGETLELGTAVLRVVGTVQHCVMPNFAQSELRYDARILRLLVHENAMQLGVYAEVVRPGTIPAVDNAPRRGGGSSPRALRLSQGERQGGGPQRWKTRSCATR